MQGISLDEFSARRKKLMKALDGAAAVVFAGDGGNVLHGKWKPANHFLYLTGLDDEQGAAVLFDPSAEDPKHRCALFLRPLNPEVEKWDGYREEIGPKLRETLGFESIFRMNTLPMRLTAAARRTKRLACLHPFSVYPAPVSPDLEVFRKVSERVPGVLIEDRSQLLYNLRAVKSPAEMRLMEKARDATRAGYAKILPMIRPGVNELDIANTLEKTYLANGGTGLAYSSIVGGGMNGTVLHYSANNMPLNDGDLLVIDSGAETDGYACDVTRTFPVNGKFTADQREVYETVLKSQFAACKAVKAGVKMHDIDAAARDILDKAGYGHAFIHGIGHPLGLEVHDVSPDGALQAGMVITIEPGVYFPERKLGVRIEDDVVVTKKGCENLTDMIPKSVKAIEAAMR